MSSAPAASRIRSILGHRAVFGVLLVGLLSFAGFLRLTDLEQNPPGFWQDEASTGLDAYLLWTTGEDRAGEAWPIISKSFGDYPMAGYRYLAAPLVGLLGPTPGHERLVAAITGTVMVFAAFWVAARRFGRGAGLAVALSATLTPTWIHFSRYGSEAILLPASLVVGWALVDEGRDPRRRWAIWLGAAALAFSAYTYHAVKVVLPLWMIAFLIFEWPLVRSLWAKGKAHVLGPALLFALLVAPSVQAALTTGGQARGKTVLAIYKYEGMQLFRTVLSNYLSYFDPGMLFVRGGPAVAQSIPGLGLWNLIELPLIIVGLVGLFRRPELRRVAGFVLFWFLLGPLPGGLTYETHNVGRAIAWLPAPQLLAGYGLWSTARWAYARFESGARLGPRLAGASTLIALALGWAATGYAVWWCTLVRYPRVTERDWQFEITRSMRCALEQRDDERLIVSPRFQVGSVFAAYHFALEDAAAGESIWQLGERNAVAEGEIYLFPARDRLPEGVELCRIVHGPTGRVYAYVYGHQAAGPQLVPPTAAPNPSFVAPRLDIGRAPRPPAPKLREGAAKE